MNKINTRVGVDCVTPSKDVIERGLSLIISHFEEPVWPRTISTHSIDDRQLLVYNSKEVLARFYQANFLNCKISAFPSYTEYEGINRQPPNFIFIDLDLSHFRNREALDRCLIKVLSNIKEKLNFAYPTVFYPFLIPIISPGTNPNVAAIGRPDAATADGCDANCVAVLLSA